MLEIIGQERSEPHKEKDKPHSKEMKAYYRANRISEMRTMQSEVMLPMGTLA
jgi:hypothetical protein